MLLSRLQRKLLLLSKKNIKRKGRRKLAKAVRKVRNQKRRNGRKTRRKEMIRINSVSLTSDSYIQRTPFHSTISSICFIHFRCVSAISKNILYLTSSKLFSFAVAAGRMIVPQGVISAYITGKSLVKEKNI